MYPYEIGGVITLYGILVGLGVLACFIVFWVLSKRDKVDPKYVDFISIDGIIAGGTGFGFAALFQSVYDYISHPELGFRYTGLTFQGGLIGGAAVFLLLAYLFRKKFKGKLIDVVSTVPLGILLGHSIGRVGCFMAGCCYGRTTDSWIGVRFIDPETGERMAEKVIPTNLIEAVFLFAAFVVLLIIYLKKRHPYNLPLYMILYGIFRFMIGISNRRFNHFWHFGHNRSIRNIFHKLLHQTKTFRNFFHSYHIAIKAVPMLCSRHLNLIFAILQIRPIPTQIIINPTSP